MADVRGSVIAVTNAAGAVTSKNTYDSYGAPASGNVGRFQYTGQMWMAELKLYHFKARAYHPALGRFLQTDPIGYGDGLNLYQYAGSDPVNARDPSGNSGCPNGENCDEVVTDGSKSKYPASAGATGYGARFGRVFGGGRRSRNQIPEDEIVVVGQRRPRAALGSLVPPIGIRTLFQNKINGDRARDCVLDTLKAQGLRNVQTEVRFSTTNPFDYAIVDIVGSVPLGEFTLFAFVEVKFGDGPISRQQRRIYPRIGNGSAIPRGPRAAAAGLTPGESLLSQGVMNLNGDGVITVIVNDLATCAATVGG